MPLIKQMKYFQAVVRTGSFTRAAEECFISQSAISQQIQALERELGVNLMHREKRNFSLTPAGEHFYKKSLIIVSDFDRLREETVHIASGGAQDIIIGYLKAYCGQELRQAIPNFHENFPDVYLKLKAGTHEELYNYLRSGKVDVAFSEKSPCLPPFHYPRRTQKHSLHFGVISLAKITRGNFLQGIFGAKKRVYFCRKHGRSVSNDAFRARLSAGGVSYTTGR